MNLKTYTFTVYRLFLQWTLPVLLIVLFLLPAGHHVTAIKWLALAKSKVRHWNQTKHCVDSRRNDGLVKQQVRICKQNLELMGVVAHASRETGHVCQELFKDRRWNCSSVGHAPNYMADLTGGSREQAFVYALSSAALTRAISKACSIGATTKCSCGRLPNEPAPGEFKWGGCGDDIYFGLAFSKLFADAQFVGKKRKLSKRSRVNLHNTGVGRRLSLQIVSDSLATACKCHGVSGSCSIKTCWKALPDLRDMGVEMQKKYAVAVEVESKKQVGETRKLVPVTSLYDKRREYKPDDLIYFTKSPDYCLPDVSLGSIGTRDRECHKDNRGSAGCQSMCCGRGFTSQVIEIKQRCDCKYYWCCYVKCKTCIKKVEINRCR